MDQGSNCDRVNLELIVFRECATTRADNKSMSNKSVQKSKVQSDKTKPYTTYCHHLNVNGRRFELLFMRLSAALNWLLTFTRMLSGFALLSSTLSKYHPSRRTYVLMNTILFPLGRLNEIPIQRRMSDRVLLLQLAACGEMRTTESPMIRMSLHWESRLK